MGLGGVERVVRDLAYHFNAGRFRTSVCCLDSLGEFGEELATHGVRVQVLTRRPGVDVALVRRLARLYDEEGVDIVHAHQYTPYFYAATACLLRPAVKTVFTEHGREYPDRVRLKRAVYNQMLRMVTASYTAVSEFTRLSMATFERMPSSRIRVIYNGVPPCATRPSPVEARKALEIDPAARVIVTIGRMDRVKDFATLIRALPRVAAEFPETVLLVAGDGDPAYLAELAVLVAGLELGTRIRFLGARLDVETLLAACDVFVLTSLTEAASMAVLEAMRAGRPVVATDVGGNRELVIPETTGLLAPAGDSSRVADALIRLLRDPKQAQQMGIAGEQRVAAAFSTAAAFEEYRQIYCSIAPS